MSFDEYSVWKIVQAIVFKILVSANSNLVILNLDIFLK